MMNGTTFGEFQRLLDSIDSTKDLRTVSTAVKDRWNLITARTARQFNEGDRVRWSGRRGPQEGVITQVNRKTIKVLVADKGSLPVRWSVSPNLLERVS
jgi:hypothetical protein